MADDGCGIAGGECPGRASGGSGPGRRGAPRGGGAGAPTRRSTLRRQLVHTDVLMVLPAWLLAPLGPWAPGGPHWAWWVAAPAFTAATVLGAGAGRPLPGPRVRGPLHRGRPPGVRQHRRGPGRRPGGPAAPRRRGHDRRRRRGRRSSPSSRSSPAGPIYRNWLLAQRATGKLLRNVAMVGADEEAGRLGAYLVEHPEVGYDVVGYFRSCEGHAAHLARPMLGPGQRRARGAAGDGGRRRDRRPRRPAARRVRRRDRVAPRGQGARPPGHGPAGHRQPSHPLAPDGPRAAPVPGAGGHERPVVRLHEAPDRRRGRHRGAWRWRPRSTSWRRSPSRSPTAARCSSARSGAGWGTGRSSCSSCAA